jgi:HPt (histidine-containing phosphotransfer) domain-containing protein
MQVPEKLKRKYIERRIQDIEQLMSSLESEDFDPAVRIGHQIKGNANTFDFPQMAPIAREIETAGKNRDKQTLKDLIEMMQREVRLASVQYLH